MRARIAIQRSPFFIVALLSTLLFCFWLAPEKPGRAGVFTASMDEDEMDAVLQKASLEALRGREGAVVVLDAQTGRIRAVVNSQLAFEEALAPGSTIKPFTALAGLRAGLIDAKSRLACRAPYAHEEFEIDCSHAKESAPFNPSEALAYSCNYYFARLGERLSEDSFNDTLASFGFGQGKGSLPHEGRMQPRNALGESKTLLVTPLQLITAYAALFNDGHLYSAVLAPARGFNKRERARLSIAPAHRAVLLEGLRGAVLYGTAESARMGRLPIYIFGKTGTATAPESPRTQGWFVGLASGEQDTETPPPESVKLAVLVFLKNAHGAECAEASRTIFEAFSAGEGERARSALKKDEQASQDASQVRVYLASEARTVTVSFEDYVLGVLAQEGATESEPEALKALAVSVRTYALRNLKRHEAEGYDFCSTTHCQRFALVERGISDAVRRAMKETANEVLLDAGGRVADAYFHAACGGMTADVETLWGSEGRSYLRGVRDEYCANMPHRRWVDVIPATRLAEALRRDARTDVGSRLENLVVSKKDRTGRAELITLEGERRRVVRGWDFKIIVGRALGWNLLKSSRFDVARSGADFVFRGGGFGHGAGLCQEGAHVMAERGMPYRQILNYYFPGTSVGSERRATGVWKADLLTRDFAASHGMSSFVQTRWLSLTSEHFHLSYTASVSKRDAEGVLGTLEAARSSVMSRVASANLNPDASQKIEVVLHETTGNFTSATGQPYWAAAATRENRIELQPLPVLRRRGVLATTLRHEYAHALIDALSRGRAPRWLAEGLAIHVAGEGQLYARFKMKENLSTEMIEQRLALTSSADDMRALYAEAYLRVRALIRARGEASLWRRVAQRE